MIKFILNFLFLFFSSFGYPADVLLNQTLGMVEDDVVSQRDVLLSVFIESQMNGAKTSGVSLTPQEMAKELNSLLVELMIGKESPPIDPDAQERQTMQSLWQKIEGDSFAKKLSLKIKEFELSYLRKKRVKAFMELKVSSFAQTPSQEEVRIYYENNKSKFGNTPLEQVSDNIRTFLTQTQRDAKLKAWLEGLRKKYRAQNYISEKQK